MIKSGRSSLVIWIRGRYKSSYARDKLVYILALLKLELVQKKVLIFTNSIDMSFRLKLFFEQFGIKSAVLNAELPQNSRQHILEIHDENFEFHHSKCFFQDVARSVTKIAVRESRAQDLRNEILNSEK
ncbi:hypothetical protein ACJIZ3_014976 [Penstemon smallii]|uniref:Helicase C-terminal domain-containing protein n=1 Tax=Penstemon smallii TaxID=265156 RepID=A0ABD3RLA3_9LAMI